MAYWLYQINAKGWWTLERYRTEVWEGQLVTNWTTGEARRRPKDISPGDIITLYMVKSGTDDPGIYGWGVITSFHKEEFIDFRPSPPSDYLKMNPLWDDKISVIIDKIRGGMPEGTVFPVDKKELKQIRQKIAGHVYGVTP